MLFGIVLAPATFQLLIDGMFQLPASVLFRYMDPLDT
jgi:hypothetical protein